MWVDHRSGHLISMLHTHLSFLSSQSKPSNRVAKNTEAGDWGFHWTEIMKWFVYMLLQIWQAGYECLFSAFHLPNLSSFYICFSGTACLGHIHTYTHTDNYSQMILRRWQENRIFCHPLLSFSLTHDNAEEAQSVLCSQHPGPQSSRFTSCSLTWITLFPELYN